MKTAILLGAGSSEPAGFPSTKSLTDRVLSGNGVWRHSDSTYCINDDQLADEVTRLVKCVIPKIHTEVVQYYASHPKGQANYEDLYYLVTQMHDEESGESENPAICDLAARLRKDLEPLASTADMEYVDLLRELDNYIADIVWKSLSRKATSSDHLKTLGTACKSNYISSISTLCHDTNVETYFEAQGISLDNGFSDEESGVRHWHGNFTSNDAITYLKLHGSVNWFLFRPDESEFWYDDRIGMLLNGYYQHTKRDGRCQHAVGDQPLMLLGTFNKMSDYTRGIFHEIHCQFRLALHKSCQLLVCGYSFGDKGINSAILNWYYAKRGRRLLIIHPNPEELARKARGAIWNKWDKWVMSDGVILIHKKLEKVKEYELLGHLKKEL